MLSRYPLQQSRYKAVGLPKKTHLPKNALSALE